MFTGLIEEVGQIRSIETTPEGSTLVVSAQHILEGIQKGDSIAIDGACTTVVAFDKECFTIEASLETLSKTTFQHYVPNSRVNLERPLRPSDRLGGHFVTGHIDGTARIVSRRKNGNAWVFRFEVQESELASLLVEKGSVAVSGISLTVNTVIGNIFSVAIIPHTLANTNLEDYDEDDIVNIEMDLLGKYVQRLLGQGRIDAAPEPAPQARIYSGNWFCHDIV